MFQKGQAPVRRMLCLWTLCLLDFVFDRMCVCRCCGPLPCVLQNLCVWRFVFAEFVFAGYSVCGDLHLSEFAFIDFVLVYWLAGCLGCLARILFRPAALCCLAGCWGQAVLAELSAK